MLFDEIEKAHQDVWNLLLQIMEDGRLTDSHGRVVDFRNTVVVMTSNVGARHLLHGGQSLGFSAGGGEAARQEGVRRAVEAELRSTFRPEFLNRVDETVVFRQLTEADLTGDRPPPAGRGRQAAGGPGLSLTWEEGGAGRPGPGGVRQRLRRPASPPPDPRPGGGPHRRRHPGRGISRRGPAGSSPRERGGVVAAKAAP